MVSMLCEPLEDAKDFAYISYVTITLLSLSYGSLLCYWIASHNTFDVSEAICGKGTLSWPQNRLLLSISTVADTTLMTSRKY